MELSGKGCGTLSLITLVLVKSHCFSVCGSWLCRMIYKIFLKQAKHALLGLSLNRRDSFSFWQCNSTSGSEGCLLHLQLGCQFGGGSGVKPDPFCQAEEFAFKVSLLLRWAILSVGFCAIIKALHSLEGWRWRCVDGDGSVAYTRKTSRGRWMWGEGPDPSQFSISERLIFQHPSPWIE